MCRTVRLVAAAAFLLSHSGPTAAQDEDGFRFLGYLRSGFGVRYGTASKGFAAGVQLETWW